MMLWGKKSNSCSRQPLLAGSVNSTLLSSYRLSSLTVFGMQEIYKGSNQTHFSLNFVLCIQSGLSTVKPKCDHWNSGQSLEDIFERFCMST